MDISIYMEIVLLFSFCPLFVYLHRGMRAQAALLFICYHLSVHRQLTAHYSVARFIELHNEVHVNI